jgi:predicted molibdopterin-dependent oxidoreductase YjgC
MSADKFKIEVNGVELEATPGQMLIQVTDAAGIYIPRFCYHEKLSVAANCRMCLVEVENAPKPHEGIYQVAQGDRGAKVCHGILVDQSSAGLPDL